MEIVVEGPDQYGNDAYGKLFDDIIGDIGKSFMFRKAHLVLKPEVPLFIYSVMLKNHPSSKTIGDVASFRAEGTELHMSISNERYAPDILSTLWKQYGRGKVDQQTRFDLIVHDAMQEDIENVVVSSGEESIKEIMGAFWRSLPEGIRVRHSYVDGRVITVVATEEIMRQEFLDEGRELHETMLKESEVEEDV